MTARRSWLAALMTPLALVACTDSVVPGPPVENVQALTGGGQAGAVLDTLPEPLVVLVVDDEGKPLAGRPVTWESTFDAAQIIPVTPVTDESGMARGIAVLGFTAGQQRFIARVAGFDDAAAFDVTASPRSGFKAVSLMQGGTAMHMCALDAGGQAWCWGTNFGGELGIGRTDEWPSTQPVPQAVETSQRFTRLWGMWAGTCGLTTSAELWCWGHGSSDIVGNGTSQTSLVPARAAPGLHFLRFDVDDPLACGITLSGDAYCWGAGILGDGTPHRTSLEPVLVGGGTKWSAIAVGDTHSCAIDADNAVHCWGAPGVTGIEGTALTPTPVPGIPPLTHVTSGWGIGTLPQCGLPVAGGGTMVCWPTYDESVGGFVSQRPASVPILDVEIEGQTAMARSGDGRLWIWGTPPQCCDGNISHVPVPLEPAGPWLDFTAAEGAYGINAADSVVYRWTGFPGFGPPTGLLPSPVPAP